MPNGAVFRATLQVVVEVIDQEAAGGQGFRSVNHPDAERWTALLSTEEFISGERKATGHPPPRR